MIGNKYNEFLGKTRLATTATSAIFSCFIIMLSTSKEEMFSPPEIMMSCRNLPHFVDKYLSRFKAGTGVSHHHCLGGLQKRYAIDLKSLHMKVTGRKRCGKPSPLTYLSAGCSHRDISLPNRQYWRPYSTPITHRTLTGKIDFKTTVSSYKVDVYSFMLVASKNETIFRKETQDLPLESARCIQGTPPLNSLAVASGFLKYPEMEKRRRGRKIVLEYMCICIWMYDVYVWSRLAYVGSIWIYTLMSFWSRLPSW